MDSIRIHVTDIPLFKRCRRKWDLQVNECLVKKGYDSGPFWFGTGIHQVLAKYYKLGGIDSALDINDLMIEWSQYCDEFFEPRDDKSRQLRNEDNALAKSMLTEYLAYSKENDKDWEILEVEKEISYTLPGLNVDLVGTFDLIVKNKNTDAVYVVDHKTFKDLANPETLELDYQMTAYLYLAKKAGINPSICVYNMLRKKIPAEPELLKNGQLSIAKNIDTTAARYKRAIYKYGLDESDYSEILDRLENNAFVVREKIHRTAKHLYNFEQMLFAEIHDMLQCIESDTLKYPNPTKDCIKDCSFRDICRAMHSGGNVDLIKEMSYVTCGGRY